MKLVMILFAICCIPCRLIWGPIEWLCKDKKKKDEKENKR